MRFIKFLRKAVESSVVDLARDERQRVLLLSSMLLCFTCINCLLAITQIILEPKDAPVSYKAFLLTVSFIYIILFFLSKTKYYRVAGHLWLSLVIGSLLVIATTDPREASVATTIGYSQLAIFICSVVFSIRETILWSIFLIICVMLLPFLSPHVSFVLANALWVMLFFAAALSTLNSYLQASFVNAAKEAEQEATWQKDRAEQNLAQIESMFAHMKLGVFTLDRELVIQQRYSVYLEEILGSKNLRGQSFERLILQPSLLNADECQIVRATLESCLDEDEIFFQANEHLLPTKIQLRVNNEVRLLEISISPIIVHNLVKEMLIILRDVTQIEALKASAEAQNNELEKIWRILKLKRDDFLTFITASMIAIEEAYSHLAIDINLTFRNLHTLKGHARIVGFNDISVKVHEIENSFSRRTPMSKEEAAQLSLALLNLRTQISDYEQIFVEKIGLQTDGEKNNALQSSKMLAMASSVFTATSKYDQLEAARAFVTHLYSQPFGQLIDKIIKDAEKLASLLGKESPLVEVIGMQTPIAWNLAGILSDACVHLVRNSLDHGIEVAEVRHKKDKPPRGVISIVCEEAVEYVRITFRDDGAGLDYKKIKSSAEACGLLKNDTQSSTYEILQLIFSPRFSTKAQVTEISGLGIGLDAVKKIVEGRGGKVDLLINEEGIEDAFFPFAIRLHLPSTAAMMKLVV